MTAKLLFQLDTDAMPSVFDRVVAIDGGADHVFAQGGVRAEQVGKLVEGAIYTRGPKEKRFTAFFVGGSDLAAAEAVFAAIGERYFGGFRVSAMLDANGCNSTAAAAVALIGRAVPLAGARAVVLAGTGPVGRRAAAMLALEGAAVAITGRQAARTEAAAAAIEARFGVRVAAIEAADGAARARAVSGADVIFAAGAAGQGLIAEADWRGARGLRVVADCNPEPPLGVGGIAASDKGKDYGGVLTFGALGIGGLKLKLHRACVGQLFERNDRMLDAAEILALAKEIA